MPNTPVRAAAEGMPAAKITRRTVLGHLGAAAALVSVQEHARASEIPGSAEGLIGKETQMNMINRQSQFDVPTSLAALIEAHRAAHGAFIAALHREQELESAYFEANPKVIMIPLSIGGEQALHVNFDLDEYVDDCRNAIVTRYDEERRRLSNLRLIAPKLAEEADSLLSERERVDLKALRRLARAEEKRREAFGYAAALRDRDATSEGEMDAAEALLSHPCRTAAEGQMRADYINSKAKGGGRIIGELLGSGAERLINALLLSTSYAPEG